CHFHVAASRLGGSGGWTTVPRRICCATHVLVAVPMARRRAPLELVRDPRRRRPRPAFSRSASAVGSVVENGASRAQSVDAGGDRGGEGADRPAVSRFLALPRRASCHRR